MSKSTPILFWNRDATSDLMRAAGFSIAHSRDELAKCRRKPGFRSAPVIILAEWTSGGKRLSDFDGLRLLVELFESDLPVPRIALCSFESRSGLAKLADERGQAARLMFPFVRLPAQPSDIMDAARSARQPSEMTRVWLRDHVLSPWPLSMWEHNFKNAGSSEPEFHNAVRELARQVNARRSLLVASTAGLPVFEQLLDEADTVAEMHDETQVRELRRKILEWLAGAQRRANAATDSEPAPYSVIVVEDNNAQRQLIVSGLQRHFEHVTGYESATAALAALLPAADGSTTEAPSRRIDAIVSDWNLREDGKDDGIMQPIQGPDFLVEAASYCSGPLIALTSLPNDVVASILNAAPADVRGRLSWFPKRNAADMGNYDYGGLAHHILTGIRVSQRFRDETPAAAGFTHWIDRGFAYHYASVRCWSQERQDAFFAECGARASTIVEAFEASVSAPPFSLSLNVPSGEAADERHTFARFKDILCGRLVVLVLYNRLPALEQSYVAVLGQLHPGLWDRGQPKHVPASFKNMMSILGIGRKGVKIDGDKLVLMPHESGWLSVQGVHLHSPRLTSGEREQAERFNQIAEDIVRLLEEDLGQGKYTIEPDDEVADAASGIPETGEVEIAALQLEAAVRALSGSSGGRRDPQGAKQRFKSSLAVLVDKFDLLYSRMPELKQRLADMIGRLDGLA